MQRLLALSIALVVAAGCGADGAAEEPGTTTTSSPATSTTTESPTTVVPVTTTTTVPPATTSTSTTRPPGDLEDLVLGTDGLGIVTFGDPMDRVMSTLSALLGPPTSDETWNDTWGEDSEIGYYRAVGWSTTSLGLSVEFIDWDIDFKRLDPPVFTRWWSGGASTLRTGLGVGPGTPWASAVAAYGDQIEVQEISCEGSPESWMLRIDSGSEEPISGGLSGDPADPATTVSSLWAGRYAFSPGGC